MFGVYGLNSSGSILGSLVSFSKHDNKPYDSTHGGKFDYLGTVSFTIRTLLQEIG